MLFFLKRVTFAKNAFISGPLHSSDNAWDIPSGSSPARYVGVGITAHGSFFPKTVQVRDG